MINLVTGWFEIIKYDDKGAISIASSVETTWLPRYPRSAEMKYDQGS